MGLLQSNEADSGIPFPKGLRIHADNAPSETKNQLAFKTGAWLVHMAIYEVLSWTFFQTGHSHGLPDQRFSELRGLLFAADVLETPEDFLDVVRKVVPRQKRDLSAQHCGAISNFHEFFKPLPFTVHGHTTTHNMKLRYGHGAHYYTMMTREYYAKVADLSEVQSGFKDPPHPKDIVMLLLLLLLLLLL